MRPRKPKKVQKTKEQTTPNTIFTKRNKKSRKKKLASKNKDPETKSKIAEIVSIVDEVKNADVLKKKKKSKDYDGDWRWTQHDNVICTIKSSPKQILFNDGQVWIYELTNTGDLQTSLELGSEGLTVTSKLIRVNSMTLQIHWDHPVLGVWESINRNTVVTNPNIDKKSPRKEYKPWDEFYVMKTFNTIPGSSDYGSVTLNPGAKFTVHGVTNESIDIIYEHRKHAIDRKNFNNIQKIIEPGEIHDTVGMHHERLASEANVLKPDEIHDTVGMHHERLASEANVPKAKEIGPDIMKRSSLNMSDYNNILEKHFRKTTSINSSPKNNPRQDKVGRHHASEADVLRDNLMHVKMKTNKYYPWGVRINFKQWKIAKVIPGEQANQKGIQVGWKIVEWNGIVIDNENSQNVKNDLMKGMAGVMTLQKSNETTSVVPEHPIKNLESNHLEDTVGINVTSKDAASEESADV